MVRRLAEKFNGGIVTKNMKTFNLLIEDLNLVDIPTKNGLFTWLGSWDSPTATRIH